MYAVENNVTENQIDSKSYPLFILSFHNTVNCNKVKKPEEHITTSFPS